MQIFARDVGEIFRIDNDTRVVVLGVKGNKVRIGVDSEKVISVHREEVCRSIILNKSLQ